MALNDGLLTAPVGAGFAQDVRAALGESTADYGSLCKSAKVNKWAKYKPIKLWKTGETGVVGMLNDPIDSNKVVTSAGLQRRKNLFGLKIPCTRLIQSSGIYGSYARGMLGYLLSKRICGTLTNDYEYQVPSGTTSAPYRITDFNGYWHNATPINTDYNSGISAWLDVPVESINTIKTGTIPVGLGWPTSVYCINWNEMIKGMLEGTSGFSGSGTWVFGCEVYQENHGTTPTNAAQIATYLGLLGNNNSTQQPPIDNGSGKNVLLAEGNIDLDTCTPTLNQYSFDIDVQTNDADVFNNLNGYYCIVYGLLYFENDNYKNPLAAILPPFKPIKRIWCTTAFPFNLRCTAVGFFINATPSWRTTGTGTNNASSPINYSSGDICFRFRCPQCDDGSGGSLTLRNSNFDSLIATGSYGQSILGNTGGTNIVLCDDSGAKLQNNSVTLNTGSQTIFNIRCYGAVPSGNTTQFILKYTSPGGTSVTEMGTVFVNITKS